MTEKEKAQLPATRRTPFLFPFRTLDQLFEERWPFGLLQRETVPSVPALDMFDRDGSVVVKAEMPGIAADKVDVSVSGNELRLSGEREAESEVKEEHFYRAERSYGHIYRAVTLPEGCDTDAIEASSKDGVIEIVIPRKEGTSAKKIAVKSAG